MHKLSLTDEPSSPDQIARSSTAQSTVDAPDAVSNNQASLDETAAATAPRRTQENHTMHRSSSAATAVLLLLAVGLGVATGFGGHKLTSNSGQVTSIDGQEIQRHVTDNVKAGDVFGSADEKTFKDSAQGYLEVGGIDGEGSHRLLRPGGESQTVYLTSSVIDLDKVANMEVKVWGETYKGQKAGWLMDVGRLQVLDPAGSPPVEE